MLFNRDLCSSCRPCGIASDIANDTCTILVTVVLIMPVEASSVSNNFSSVYTFVAECLWKENTFKPNIAVFSLYLVLFGKISGSSKRGYSWLLPSLMFANYLYAKEGTSLERKLKRLNRQSSIPASQCRQLWIGLSWLWTFGMFYIWLKTHVRPAWTDRKAQCYCLHICCHAIAVNDVQRYVWTGVR